MQNETNLHNLSIFHSNIKDGNQESFWKLMLNMNRLFSIFWLVFCVVVPLAAKVSNQAKRLIRRTGVPVPSAWIGSLFLVNYFVSTLLVKVFSRGDVTKFLNELKESNYGICFAILAVYFWLEFKNAKADNFTTPKLEVIKANFSK